MEKDKEDNPVHINTGDVDIDGLCSDLEHSDVDIEEQQYKKLRGVFSGKKSGKISSPALDCVKQTIGIGVLRRRKKGNKTN